MAEDGKKSDVSPPVLIAEDDLTSRLLLDQTLKRAGYDVVSATNGKEVMDIARNGDFPRLMILDWMMPEMDGIEVCRLLRERSDMNQPYIIMLTALADKADIIKGLDAGANDYVTKPFHRGELLARVRVGALVIKLQRQLGERVEQLEEALEQIKTLEGVIPICMYCHKIRTEEEAWHKMERYIEEHSNAQFSHGICPSCMEEKFPEGEEDD